MNVEKVVEMIDEFAKKRQERRQDLLKKQLTDIDGKNQERLAEIFREVPESEGWAKKLAGAGFVVK